MIRAMQAPATLSPALSPQGRGGVMGHAPRAVAAFSTFLPSPSRGEGPGERVTTVVRSAPTPAIGLHPCRSGALAAIRAVAPSRHRPGGGPPTYRSTRKGQAVVVRPLARQQARAVAVAAIVQPTPTPTIRCRSGALAAIRAVAPSRHRPGGGPPAYRSTRKGQAVVVQPRKLQQPRTGAFMPSGCSPRSFTRSVH